MKRLVALLIAAFPIFAFAQSSDVYVSISYTSAAAAYATASGTTVASAVGTCVDGMNNRYAAQGIGVRLQPIVDAYSDKAALSDSVGGNAMFNYAQNSVTVLRSRKNASASMAIMVFAPATGAGAILPSPPTIAKNAVGAVTQANLCGEFENAVSRNLGAGNGYAKRSRSIHGNNVCFHTQEALPSDPAEIVPYNNVWRIEGDPNTDEAAPNGSCQLLLGIYRATGVTGYQTTYYNASVSTLNPGPAGNGQYCTIYSQSGAVSVMPRLISYIVFNGGSTISCQDGDLQLQQYSSTSGAFQGVPIGDSTHNDVAAINANISRVLGFPSSNATLLAKAIAATHSWIREILFD